MNRKYVLITGANSGLGKALSLECAKRGFNIIMLEQAGTNIHSTAQCLQYIYHIDTRVFEFDLTDTMKMYEHLKTITEEHDIFFLINNAGIGGTSSITETSLEWIDKIISINVKSMALLTRMLIPALLTHEKSYILNVASMAAFTPIAYKTVYPASKAFVSSFSLGLKEELAEKGVSVSVLYPGPIMTNSSVTQRIISLGLKGKIGLLSTDEIAQKAIQNTLKGKSAILPGLMNSFNQFLMNLVPANWRIKIVSKEIKKEMLMQTGK